MEMNEGLKIQGEVTLTAMTEDGDICGVWKSTNTGCIAGLNDLVGAIAYSAVEDVAYNIGLYEPQITPIYGAIGNGPIAVTSKVYATSVSTATTINTVPSTLAVVSTTGFPTTGNLYLTHAGTTYTVAYTGKTSTTFTGCTVASGSVSPILNDVVGSPYIVQSGTASYPYAGVGVGYHAVDVLGDLPSGTTVTAIDSTSSSYVILSTGSTGASTTNSIMFSPNLPSSSDTTLQSEITRAAAVYAGSSQGSYVTTPKFTWQFQFPVNLTTSPVTITEAGTFLLASPSTNGGGDMLNHAFINPPAVWGSGQMLMLSVSIGLQP
jgi:hypothetical protein